MSGLQVKPTSEMAQDGHASLRAVVRCNQSSSYWHGSRRKTSLVVRDFRKNAKLTGVLACFHVLVAKLPHAAAESWLPCSRGRILNESSNVIWGFRNPRWTSVSCGRLYTASPCRSRSGSWGCRQLACGPSLDSTRSSREDRLGLCGDANLHSRFLEPPEGQIFTLQAAETVFQAAENLSSDFFQAVAFLAVA